MGSARSSARQGPGTWAASPSSSTRPASRAKRDGDCAALRASNRDEWSLRNLEALGKLALGDAAWPEKRQRPVGLRQTVCDIFSMKFMRYFAMTHYLPYDEGINES